MNRKGFLKRIAGAIGLVAVGKEVVAEPMVILGNRKMTYKEAQIIRNYETSRTAQLCAKDFDVRCEEQRLADMRFCDVQGSQWEDKPFPFKREDRPKFTVYKPEPYIKES